MYPKRQVIIFDYPEGLFTVQCAFLSLREREWLAVAWSLGPSGFVEALMMMICVPQGTDGEWQEKGTMLFWSPGS